MEPSEQLPATVEPAKDKSVQLFYDDLPADSIFNMVEFPRTRGYRPVEATPQLIREVIDDWASSKENQAEVCERHGIKARAFRYACYIFPEVQRYKDNAMAKKADNYIEKALEISADSSNDMVTVKKMNANGDVLSQYTQPNMAAVRRSETHAKNLIMIAERISPKYAPKSESKNFNLNANINATGGTMTLADIMKADWKDFD